jgi:hypothetical protein
LKRKVLLSILAAVFAAFLPLAAAAQASAAADRPEPSYKYTAYVGYGYTGLNQVNGSRYGLQGVNADLERNFGKYFALTMEGDFYKYALNTGGATSIQGTGSSTITFPNVNPGTPSVVSLLAGPVIRVPITGRVDGFVNFLLGEEHTAGEAMSPSTSFAGGYGGGLGYKLGKHLWLRASGERIGASFSFIDNNGPNAGNSSHKTWNPRASFGVAYRF